MGTVNPIALQLVKEMGYPLNLLRSKSWDEFGREGAPHMDFIITVCDEAAGEECPYWPGHPSTAHWGFPDPSKVEGHDAQLEVFRKVEMGLRNRIEHLINLPVDKLDHLEIKDHLHRIHQQFQ